MTEETKYKTKRFVQNGVIRYQKVEATAEDLLQERDLEIKHLHELIDTLREHITQLEQEKQRYELRDVPMVSADSYQIYK